MKYQFIAEHCGDYPVTVMCYVLEVSTSGYYAWHTREPSQHSREDAVLAAKVEAAFEHNRRVYGSPRIHAELHAEGIPCGQKRVARLMRELGISAQLARYHVENKQERTAFVAALKYLLERVPLEVDVRALLSRWRWFAEGCVGCIGVLKDWLVDAVVATLVQKGTRLTEDVLTRTMPHPARRLSLEMEARAGEHTIALHESESAKQFQALWKKPAKSANGKTDPTPGSISGEPPVDHIDETAEIASAIPPMPPVFPKPTPPRVGQRAPGRDPVGETVPPLVGKGLGCSFTEVIGVSLAQAEEAGVSHFECPTCLAVRFIPPKGGISNFPGIRSARLIPPIRVHAG